MAAGRCNHFLLFVLTILLLAVHSVHGQDKIVTPRDVLMGKIIGTTSDGSPKIRLEGGTETSFPRSQIIAIEMVQPREFVAARELFTAGKWQEALRQITPVASIFGGLDVPWAMEALLLQGGAEMEIGAWADAKKTSETVARLYAKTPLTSWASVVNARAAVAAGKGQESASRSLLPLLKQLGTEITPSPASALLAAEANYAMGLLLEAQSNYNEALAHYLAVAVLQPGLSAWEPHATGRADLLRRTRAAFVP